MKKRAFGGAFFAIRQGGFLLKSEVEKENARFFQKGLAKSAKMCYNIGCKFCWCSTGVVQLIRNQQVESSNLSTSSNRKGMPFGIPFLLELGGVGRTFSQPPRVAWRELLLFGVSRTSPPLQGWRFSANNAATLAFPKGGKGDQRSWWMRMSALALREIALPSACAWVCIIHYKSRRRAIRESPLRVCANSIVGVRTGCWPSRNESKFSHG